MGKRLRAPEGERCSVCDLDVGGWRLGRTSDGKRTFERPTKVHVENSGFERISGGLVHIEGGQRCRPELAKVLG